jgi:hypothetical protein
VLEFVCSHDNNLPVPVYLDPSNLHAGGLSGTECPCHVLLSEYCGGSGHGQETGLSVVAWICGHQCPPLPERLLEHGTQVSICEAGIYERIFQ